MPTAFQILQVLPALSTPVKHSDNAAMISNMSALDDLGRADIKAIGIVGLIHMASSMPGSTDYRTNHTQLIQDATTFWGGVSNIDDNGTSKTVLIIQASLAWDIGKEVEFLAALREGEEQADRGEVVPHEQVKKEFASWISK